MPTDLYTTLQKAFTKARTDFNLLLPDFQISAGQEHQALSFMALMLEQNQTLNLSAITDPEEAIYLHLLDSWTLLPLLDQEATVKSPDEALSVLDLGTGAGFPGVPVKILRPDIDLYLVDALAKRLKFLDRALGAIALTQPWQCVHARAEDLGRKAPYRDQLDLVTARALANLPVLLEYALPLVKPGGVFVAMKAKYQDELSQAGQAASKLGAELEDIQSFVLPQLNATRTFLIYRKRQATPPKYPRSNAHIKKSPLH